MMRDETSPGTRGGPGALEAFRGWSGLDSGRRLSEILLGAAVVVAPLAAGTVHTQTTTLLVLLVLLALWLRALASLGERTWRGWTDPLPLVLLGILVWQVFTLLPLGRSTIETLSPVLAENLNFSELADVVTWTLSYAPGATAWEVLKLAGATAALLLSIQISRTSHGRRRIAIITATALLVFLVITTLQSVSGTEAILWFYRPAAYTGLGSTSLVDLRTTFVNPNHAAQFLEVTGLGALAYGVLSDGRYRFAFVAVGLLALMAIMLTGSTAGIAVAGWSCAFVASLAVARRWNVLSMMRWIVPVCACIGGVAALVTLAGPSTDRELSWCPEWVATKVQAWPSTVAMVRENPWLGIGRGAFRDALPQFQLADLSNSFTFAENEPLQLWSELGLPLGSLLMLAIIITWFVSLARWRGRPEHAAALAGTLAVGMHSFVGFGLEFGGVGLPFTAYLGTVVATARGRDRPTRTRTWIPLALATVLTGALILAPRALTHGEYTDVTRHVLDAARSGGDMGAVNAALRQRPCSPDVSLAVAAYHAALGDPFANLRWLSRTMVLAPRDATPHRLAAQTLADLGKGHQAMLEIRTALEMSATGHGPCFRVLASIVHTTGDVDRVFGDDEDGKARFASYLFRNKGSHDLARAIVADLEGTSSAIASARAEASLDAGEPAAAEKALRAYLAADPDDRDATISLARTLAAQDRPEDGHRLLDELLETRPHDAAILLEMARIARASGDAKQARRDIRRARVVLDPTDTRLLADLQVLDGDLYREAGDYSYARDAYRRALQTYPSMHHVRTRLGLVYREMGNPEAALRELRRVRRELGQRDDLDLWIRELEAEVGP